MFFVKCTDRKKKSEEINLQKEIQVTTTEKKDNTFLVFNPRMSNSDFYKAIDSLNQAGKLSNGKFIVSINNNDLPFQIEKTNAVIKLTCSKIEEKSIENKDERLYSYLYLTDPSYLIDDFKGFFEKKYKTYKSEIPRGSELKNFGFDEYGYELYKTPERVILVGHTLIGFDKKNPTNNTKTMNFGYKLEINYYLNSDFKPILDSLLNLEKEFQKKIDEEYIERTRIRKIKSDNLKEL